MALTIDGLASSAPIARSGKGKPRRVNPVETSWAKKGFASALDHLGIVSITDAGGRILHVNDEFVGLSQYTRDELIGRTHAILNSAHHSEAFWAEAYHTLASGKTWRAPIMNRAKDGSFYWTDALIAPLSSRNGLKGFLSVQRDITELVALRAALEERTSLLHALVESFPGTVAAFDKAQKLILSNRQWRELVSQPDELFAIGQPIAEQFDRGAARITKAGSATPHTVEQQRPNGTHLEVRYTPLPHGVLLATQANIADSGRGGSPERKHIDALTGLPDRSLFLDRIRQSMAKRGQNLIAVHCLDLDGLKLVNESLGYPAGDLVLKCTAERLSRLLGKYDTAARLGGDDFAILQAAPSSIENVESLTARIISSLSEPIMLNGSDVRVGVTVGISLVPTDGTEAEQLIRNADTALWRVKSLARGSYGFFEPSMSERLRQRISMTAELRKALATNQFELHYQPIINIKTLKITGCEALIRWPHPERGLVSASDFIPIAEECGLIGQIGDWVLKTACAEVLRWPDDISIAVNISAAQFSDPKLVDKILEASKGLRLSRLVLEITETLLLKDRDAAAATLGRMKKLGVRFAIDDFGTGFSSLSYLQSFPFDKIKIDRSFISNTANQKRSATLRRSIIQLGYNLGMTSVAEGVETKQQLDLLRAEGCIEAQGFLFSPAVPGRKIRELFANAL